MDPMTMAAMLQLAGGFASAFGQNPYDKASEYAGNIQGAISPYYQPYINTGLNALNKTYGEYGNLINNPSSYLSRFGGDIYGGEFQQSPGYDWQYTNAMNAANNAAAAGGMLGTQAHQQNAATTATQLANQDYYNYLRHQLGISQMGKDLYTTGLGGMQGLNMMGFNASDSLAQAIAQSMMAQAGLAAMSANKSNTGLSGMLGGLF